MWAPTNRPSLRTILFCKLSKHSNYVLVDIIAHVGSIQLIYFIFINGILTVLLALQIDV